MGKVLSVVGIGPGFREGMTFEADEALREAEVIIGYGLYVKLVEQFYPQAEYRTTGMRKETERCRMALEEAEKGHVTALICSGDAGVYGMAGLVLELAGGRTSGSPSEGSGGTFDRSSGEGSVSGTDAYRDVEIRVIPGVSAVLSGGARLGSPIGHDFCVISLSDLLTPKELIGKRLRAAAEGDFCVCIYNPASHGRPDYLARACEILMEGKAPETVCGYVRNIGREGEETGIMTLAEMKEFPVDMLTTVFIGNSRTRIINGKMVTPRGYRLQ